ncbi:hypothetical protein PENTCL1PPCAC_25003, partial [Pristionchus entomophagus]
EGPQMRIIDRSRLLIYVCVAYLVNTNHALQVGDRFFLDDSIASELEDWELRWLKDAVRRGRAFVSKGGVQKNGEFEDDDWETFARKVQAQNDRSSSVTRPAAIPAPEPSFLGSFGAAPPSVISIGPSPSSSGSTSFSHLPGVRAGHSPAKSEDNAFFFGSMDPSMFMQPVIVQPQQHQATPPQQQPQPIVPSHKPRPITRRIGPTPTRPPPPPPPSRTSSRTESEMPEDGVDFTFDHILRQLISRRQKQLADDDDGEMQQLQPPTTTAAAAPKRRKMRPLKHIITGSEEEAASMKFHDADRERKRPTTPPPALPGHPPNEWVMMDPDDSDPEREEVKVPDQLPVPTLQQLQQP